MSHCPAPQSPQISFSLSLGDELVLSGWGSLSTSKNLKDKKSLSANQEGTLLGERTGSRVAGGFFVCQGRAERTARRKLKELSLRIDE